MDKKIAPKVGFGSREPIRKANPNYVHEGIIRTQAINNERKFEGTNTNEHYQMNPFSCIFDFLMSQWLWIPGQKVTILTEKPTAVKPSDFDMKKRIKKGKQEATYTDDPVGKAITGANLEMLWGLKWTEAAFSNAKIEKGFKDMMAVPKNKSKVPATSNQEVGWFSETWVSFWLSGAQTRLKGFLKIEYGATQSQARFAFKRHHEMECRVLRNV